MATVINNMDINNIIPQEEQDEMNSILNELKEKIDAQEISFEQVRSLVGSVDPKTIK